MLERLLPFIIVMLLSFACAAASEIKPLAVFSPSMDSGISIVSISESTWNSRVVKGLQAVSLEKGSYYLYFKVDPEVRKMLGAEVFLVVELYDEVLNGASIQYNSDKADYQQGPWFRTTGSGNIDKRLIHLKDAKFRGTQNGGADFRLKAYGQLTITKIEVYDKHPGIKFASEAELCALSEKTLEKMPKSPKPKGMYYTLGDPYEVTEWVNKHFLRFGHCADDVTAKLCRTIGATSIESYVTWETVEAKSEGQWDWSYWDRQVEVLKKNDLKWVPFLILGPAYSTPDWFRAGKDHFPCRCLEHGTDSKIESLWNPNLSKWIDRFIGEFAKRYKDSGIIESLLLGIQGDYGEAIYSASGGWTESIPGHYHSHPGFWCGDSYAIADFRDCISKKYKSIDAVNTAWGTEYSSFDEVDFPGRGDALTEFRGKTAAGDVKKRRRWLDFVDWYRASMTNLADQWMAITRKHFPNTPIYLCTGGDAIPEHGSDFAEQCRIAAKYGGGVRITNEGSSYQWNFVITRWVAAAAKHYGAYFGFEPAAAEDEVGIVARIYNATASGVNQLHDYTTNLIRYQSTIDAQQKHFKYLFHVENPVVPVALWYPNVTLTLNGGNVWNKFVQLRDYTDYDYVDETMLRTNALARYKILVILRGEVMETSDAKLIAKWARDGGRVIVMDVPKIESVEGTDEPERLIFDASLKNSVTRVTNWDELENELRKAHTELNLPIYDLKKDGIYGTQISENRFLFLNTADDAKVEINKRSYPVTGRTIADIKVR